MPGIRSNAFAWTGGFCVVILTLAILMVPRKPPPPAMPDAVDKRPSPAERAAEIEKQLDSVAKPDHDISNKLDLTPEQIDKATSVELLTHFTSSGMRIWLGLYSDPEVGVQRAIRGSTTLRAFVERPDVMEAFVAWNRRCAVELRNVTASNGGELASHIIACDDLLKSTNLFQKTIGHERVLLSALCERYRAMIEVNERFSEDEKPFGASLGSAAGIIRLLARAIDPAENWDEGNDSELITRSEALVR